MCTFAAKIINWKGKEDMTAMVLERETNTYWNLIKNLSAEVKLALISRLSNSLINDVNSAAVSSDSLIDNILENAPKDAPLSDEDIIQEIKAVRYALGESYSIITSGFRSLLANGFQHCEAFSHARMWKYSFATSWRMSSLTWLIARKFRNMSMSSRCNVSIS